jgi:indolepyruvate ferredoxin oxidoreductase
MAYKDEYEVARLHADPAFAAEVAKNFEGDYRLTYHLAPPILARRDPTTGLPVKREFGSWMGVALRGLARFKFLRGTPFDPFGYARDRELERRLIVEYEEAILARCGRLRAETIPELTELAASAQSIRGFGHVKQKAAEETSHRWSARPEAAE